MYIEKNNKNYVVPKFENLEDLCETNNEIEQNLKELKFKARGIVKNKKVIKLDIIKGITQAREINLATNLNIINPNNKICEKKSKHFKGKMLIKIEMRIRNKNQK